MNSAELSQRLFDNHTNNNNNNSSSEVNSTLGNSAPSSSSGHLVTLARQQQQQQKQQRVIATSIPPLEFSKAAISERLASSIGLKIKCSLQNAPLATAATVSTATHQLPTLTSLPSQASLSSHPSTSSHTNSLVKQQLKSSLKERIDAGAMNSSCTVSNTLTSNESQLTGSSGDNNTLGKQMEACAALQSLANIAERQAHSNLQPPSATNLHQQFLFHMAANPILKTTGNYFQHQQQQHHQRLSVQHRHQFRLKDDGNSSNNIDLSLDQSDKSDPEILTLMDENVGLGYNVIGESSCNSTTSHRNNNNSCNRNKSKKAALSSGNSSAKSSSVIKQTKSQIRSTRSKNSTNKPIQRRRIRRKAQSTLDDQAEQLTEMSVRGLDLFRYASINDGVYQCTECAKENMQKTFKNKYSFQRHAFLYHEGKHRKVFPCPLCGKEFSRPDKMKNHMKMTHEMFAASKDMQNFNQMNCLLTVATAGGDLPTNNLAQQGSFSNANLKEISNAKTANSSAITSLLNIKRRKLELSVAKSSIADGGNNVTDNTKLPLTSIEIDETLTMLKSSPIDANAQGLEEVK